MKRLALILSLLLCFAQKVGAVVSTTGFTVTYSGNGSTNSFSYPDYLFESSDLVVTGTLSGATTNYAYGAHPGFTFTGTQDTYGSYPSGGNVSFLDSSGNPLAPTNGTAILVTRQTPKTQIVHFIDNNPLSAVVLEHCLDKLTLMAQEAALFIGFTNGSPVTTAGQSLGCSLGQWEQNASVAAGGNFGWICTTAGVDGSAVWSPFGLVSQ